MEQCPIFGSLRRQHTPAIIGLCSSSRTLYFRIYGIHIHSIMYIRWYSAKLRTYIQRHYKKLKYIKIATWSNMDSLNIHDAILGTVCCAWPSSNNIYLLYGSIPGCWENDNLCERNTNWKCSSQDGANIDINSSQHICKYCQRTNIFIQYPLSMMCRIKLISSFGIFSVFGEATRCTTMETETRLIPCTSTIYWKLPVA